MDGLAVEGVRPPAAIASVPGGSGPISPARRPMGKSGSSMANGGRISPLPLLGGGDNSATPALRRRPSSRGPANKRDSHRAVQDPSSTFGVRCSLGWTQGTAALAPRRACSDASRGLSASPEPPIAEAGAARRAAGSIPAPVPPTTPLRAPAMRRSGSLQNSRPPEREEEGKAAPRLVAPHARRTYSARGGRPTADVAPAASPDREGGGGPPRRVDTGLRELRRQGFRVLRRRPASRKPSAELRRAMSTRPHSGSRSPRAALPAAATGGRHLSPRPATVVHRTQRRTPVAAASPKGPAPDSPSAIVTPPRRWKQALDTGLGAARRKGAVGARSPVPQACSSDAEEAGKRAGGHRRRVSLQVDARAEQQRAQQRAVERAKRMRGEEASKDSLAREAVEARRRARREAREEEEQRRAEVYATNAIMRAWHEQRSRVRGGAGSLPPWFPARCFSRLIQGLAGRQRGEVEAVGESGAPASPGSAHDRAGLLGV